MIKAGTLGGVFVFFAWITYLCTHPKLPHSDEPICFYSNQTQDDLKLVFQKAIEQARRSLFVQMYGCTDPDLLASMDSLHQKGLQVDLLYDPSGSGRLSQSRSYAHPLKVQGLMHKKILIIDEQQVYLGSANFTTQSLKMHDNIVIGLHHPILAHFLVHSVHPMLSFEVGDQKAEFWHLPDTQDRCLAKILQILNDAKHSIQLAVFTFTHPQILETLIRAHRKGVNVQVALDYYTAKGAGKYIFEQLQKAGIPVILSRGDKLLHYKWAWIDSSIFIMGSANWTQAAFAKNEDFVLILEPLTSSQIDRMQRLWKQIYLNKL
jgi:cardiolipin synthase A/B